MTTSAKQALRLTAPIKRSGGTKDFGDWQVAGEIIGIYEIDEIEVGEVLFEDDSTYNCVNLCVITKKDANTGKISARYIDPKDPSSGLPGVGPESEFSVRGSQLGDPDNRFFKRFFRAFSYKFGNSTSELEYQSSRHPVNS